MLPDTVDGQMGGVRRYSGRLGGEVYPGEVHWEVPMEPYRYTWSHIRPI